MTSQTTTAMHPPSTEGDTLDQLQTPEQVALLDAIDELRGQGLDHHGINLPQLIVCGEQSTGKSSLLEGLTRLRFPTKGTLCTTFATEVVLRRAAHTRISCTITPSEGRSLIQARDLTKFERTFSSREEFCFPSVIDEAKALMTQGSKTGLDTLVKDVLRIRYSGPDLPSLTIVDLPGMIEEDMKDVHAAARIVDLVTGYMRNEKSIILAVVMAGNDPENQKPMKYIREYDPSRSRTLGVITKPDKVDRGSDSEIDLLRLARNEKHPLKHGWYAVRNRDFATKDHSDAERDELERQFFNSGLWSAHPRNLVGIASLRAKLSKVLLDHITMELPSLVTSIQGAIEVTEAGLKALGNTRETIPEQRTYLTGHAAKFQMLTNEALKGIYSDRFFKRAAPNEQAAARLRTAIQNLNIAFTNTMYRKGHTWDIDAVKGGQSKFLGDSYPAMEQYANRFEDPEQIDRAVFLESHIGPSVRESRQSGLPSLVNPSVIGDVFQKQSQNWSEIAKHHLQQVFQAVKEYIEEALQSLLDPRTRGLLMLKEIQPELDRRWSNVNAKLEELLVPYTEQDPITYDPGFLRDLEEMRATRSRVKVEGQFQSVQNPFAFGNNGFQSTSNLGQRLLTESLDDFTNSEILDLMQTYYKSAISVFVNNIAVLAIENCLIKDLSAIFSPILIANMDDGQLQAIAAECEEVRHERKSLRKKLEVLQSGKQILYQHLALRAPTRAPVSIPTIDVRPRSAVPQDQSDDSEKMKRGAIPDLTSALNNLAFTPPTSGPTSRTPSRGRHDSVTGLNAGAKKPSPRRLSLKSMNFGVGMQDSSEDDL